MKYISLVFIMLFISCKQEEKNGIIGVWKIVNTTFESDDKKIVTESGKKYLTYQYKDNIFDFKKNSDVIIDNGPSSNNKITYQKWYLKNNILKIKGKVGTYRYKILNISKDSLKLQELPLDNKKFIYEFVRMKQ
ncbi:lipocalin family protein [Aquimarina sp. 2304DJ70-9]|uniref:lipocalin family protein n=1 Tax=Aquimarina penaris TaxID=3231044 RepID=UPI003461BD17